jgi:hypothetical protein
MVRTGDLCWRLLSAGYVSVLSIGKAASLVIGGLDKVPYCIQDICEGL